MTNESAPYTLSEDDLYGGIFDISMGVRASIDIEAVRAALLFYNSIVIPDGFFTANGPLAELLKNEVTSSGADAPYGETISYLKNGLLIPGIRIGNHISDVWFKGESVGVRPGVFLSQTKDEGDKLFSALRKVPMRYALWPKPMADATTTSFGALCHRHVFDPDFGFPDPEIVDRHLASYLQDAYFSLQRRAAVQLLSDFQQFIDDNKGNPKFRRGQIEMLIGKCLGWDRFQYDRIWQGSDLDVLTARPIIQLISSLYEINQSINFGTSLFLVNHKDPISVINEQGKRLYKHGRLSTYAVQLMGEVDFSKIHARHIVTLRSDEDFRPIFEKAKLLRSSALKSGRHEDLGALLEFTKNEYAPAILKIAPEARNDKIVRVAEQALKKVSNIATETSILSLVAGKFNIGFVGVDFSSLIQTIGECATCFGVLGLLTSIDQLQWVDRFIHDRNRASAIRRLQDDISIVTLPR